MTAPEKVSSAGNWLAKLKVQHTNHPIVFGYAIVGCVMSVVMFSQWLKLDLEKTSVHKYRKYYVVLRPDDPAVRLIKNQKIGMDF